ncbi:MAG TPA: hypothetical protein VMR37_07755 [Rhabdochlamydiaceae bacterium]|jgi:hypothetical protein|nr:hypothetical protein [Rhabdochlamydiaceae bacterium]
MTNKVNNVLNTPIPGFVSFTAQWAFIQNRTYVPVPLPFIQNRAYFPLLLTAKPSSVEPNPSPAGTPAPAAAQPSIQPIATNNLTAYCNQNCPGISPSLAIEMVKRGQLLLREIQQKPLLSLSHDPEKAHRELANITWFLMHCALRKGQGFSEGTFVIEERGRLYSFLLSQHAYLRASTHCVDRSPVNTGWTSYFKKSSLHHGNDVPNGLMPAQKRTILFDLIDPLNQNDITPLFFKPENYGTQGADLIGHSKDYILTRKLVKPEDDIPGIQKEIVPRVAKQAFSNLLKHIQANLPVYGPFLEKLDPAIFDLSKASKKAALWGIAYMYAFMKGLEEQPSCLASLHEAASPLLEVLRAYDNLDKRRGREVFLSEAEFNRFIAEEISS